MGLLTPDPGLVFWMLVIFGAVFFILAKFGFPAIIKAVDSLKDSKEQEDLINRMLDEMIETSKK